MGILSYMRINTSILLIIIFSQWISAAPVTKREYILVPIRNNPQGTDIIPESRQGGIIAGWIQNSQFFPIELNVPDLISNAASGVQNFGQGLQNFGQNIGQGYQSWISNLAQRFPIINRIPILSSNRPQKYMILIPADQEGKADKIVTKPHSVRLTDYAEVFTYP